MTDKAISPLRQRMIEDMTIRKFAPKTQHDYVQRVKHFAAFLRRLPDNGELEDVRRYQLHLAATGVRPPDPQPKRLDTAGSSTSRLTPDIVNLNTQLLIHATQALPDRPGPGSN